jgi:hypothetical protein
MKMVEKEAAKRMKSDAPRGTLAEDPEPQRSLK